MVNLLIEGHFHAFSNESLYILRKYTAYNNINMVNKCAAPKCQTGYTTARGKLSSVHFPLKNEELNKNGFVSSIAMTGILQNTQFYAS